VFGGKGSKGGEWVGLKRTDCSYRECKCERGIFWLISKVQESEKAVIVYQYDPRCSPYGQN